MRDIEEQQVGDLRIRIDRALCVGFEDCVEDRPALFRLDDDGICTFVDDPDVAATDTTIATCEACPVDALEVFDAAGRKIV
ncbi:MAG: (4Fe-4S)-binding protein [Gemmatimonadota bacterium]